MAEAKRLQTSSLRLRLKLVSIYRIFVCVRVCVTFVIVRNEHVLVRYTLQVQSVQSTSEIIPILIRHENKSVLVKFLRHCGVKTHSHRLDGTERNSAKQTGPGIERVQALSDISRSRYVVIATRHVH